MYNFYDIESLSNVFSLCNWKPAENMVDVYYLVDDKHLADSPTLKDDLLAAIKNANGQFTGDITLYDLRMEVANVHLASTFGLSTAFNANNSIHDDDHEGRFRITCDSDTDYDPNKHPYFFGYNSYNYDTTMLSLYLNDVFTFTSYQTTNQSDKKYSKFSPITAKQMRDYNDELFTLDFIGNMPSYLAYDKGNHTQNHFTDKRYKIRKNMLLSGRHLDIGKLNEKMRKVQLKRLLGYLGFQIMESSRIKSKTKLETKEDFYDLIAYNCSDIFGTEFLFQQSYYQGQFSLKKGLLQTYPELMYEKKATEYAPNISPTTVRRDRMTIDSSSAQFAIHTLCPYNHLPDIPAVSFLYPSERKAKELGVPQINVLDECMKFFTKHFNDYPEPMEAFTEIYNYYKSIEGKNFNRSKYYEQDWGGKEEYQDPMDLRDIKKPRDCVFYYDANGKPTSTYVTFSTGGIHGAEYNKALYDSHMKQYEQFKEDMTYVQTRYTTPEDVKKAKKISFPDGRVEKATTFIRTITKTKELVFRNPESKKPVLFKIDEDTGGLTLNSKYYFTSLGVCSHEDFKSYYPNLLRMMSAFWNDGLGYDRYAEIFDKKELYGKLMKDESLSEEERALYAVLREGTKLVMNSASGGADAGYENNIIMNNNIISMRIIGQLFSWRIGQAQTLKGAKIISTNTDGLYSVMSDLALNNKILEEESKVINVEIEPEPMMLVSKDTNNRLEINHMNGKILSAGGGTVGCYKGPNVVKSLTHPAVIDWALSEYLLVTAFNHKNLSLFEPLNKDIAMNILTKVHTKFDLIQQLLLFQTVVVSSSSSMRYVFGIQKDRPEEPILLQHCNRVFFVKEDTPNTLRVQAAFAKKITPATKKKRERNNEKAFQHDPTALSILQLQGVSASDIKREEKEASIQKITNVEADWDVLVDNRNLRLLSENDIHEILDHLDYEKYMLLFENAYKTWQNKFPDDKEEKTETEIIVA